MITIAFCRCIYEAYLQYTYLADLPIITVVFRTFPFFEAIIIHAPGIARYFRMVYEYSPWLVTGRHLIRSLQGTLQSDPLGMFLFSLTIQP